MTLVVLYASLLGLGITTNIASLKCLGQYSREIQAVARSTILLRHELLFNISLRCLQDTWSGSGVNIDKHLAIASLISCCENRGHSIRSSYVILLRNLLLVSQFLAKLYDLWRAFHRESRVLHGWPLNLMVLIVGSDFFLTQLMRSHGCWCRSVESGD